MHFVPVPRATRLSALFFFITTVARTFLSLAAFGVVDVNLEYSFSLSLAISLPNTCSGHNDIDSHIICQCFNSRHIISHR